MLKQKEKILNLEKLKEKQKNKSTQMPKKKTRKVIKKPDTVQDVVYRSRQSEIEERIAERAKYLASLEEIKEEKDEE